MFKDFLHAGSGEVDVADGRVHQVCVRLDRADDGSIAMNVTVAGKPFMEPVHVDDDESWPRQGVLGFCHYSDTDTIKIHGFKWAAFSNMSPSA